MSMTYRFLLPVICVVCVVYVGMIWWCINHPYVLPGYDDCGMCRCGTCSKDVSVMCHVLCEHMVYIYELRYVWCM